MNEQLVENNEKFNQDNGEGIFNKRQKKYKNKKFSLFEVFILILITFCVSLILGMILGKTDKLNRTTQQIDDENLETFIENYNYIVENYYDDIDKQDLINNAIEGMMNSLDDPYSAYIDSDTSNNFNITLEGSYQGLGVSVVKDSDSGYIMVYYTFENSPAAKAGIKSGDLIKSIDGKNTDEFETSDFSNLVLNSDKTKFTLTIIRDSEEFDVNVQKENVTIDSVTSKIFERNDKKIGYIYISIFANNTDAQFSEALQKLEQENIDSLIIDVRGNTGGHLTAVENILKSLLTKKQVTYQLDKNGDVTKYYGSLNKNKEYEIVLLGDSYSASASEVLISSLKENLDSKLIGIKTYGKGTVQELITLSNGQQYKITTKKWLTPNGNWINDSEGISPDIEIELNEKYYDTYDENDDNQLQKAIEILLED